MPEMTVRDMIAALAQLDPDLRVSVDWPYDRPHSENEPSEARAIGWVEHDKDRGLVRMYMLDCIA